VNDNPFDMDTDFGIHCDETFLPFHTLGTIVYFDSRVPTDQELRELPVVLLTDTTWNPSDDSIYPHKQTREYAEMVGIRSLNSTRRQVHALQASDERTAPIENGEIEHSLGQISSTFDQRSFCNRIISAVQIATTFRDDIDELEAQRK